MQIPRFRLPVRFSFLSLLYLGLLMGLAACGENATPTQAVVTPAKTTAAATTVNPTAVSTASTPASSTTVAGPTIGITGGATGSSFSTNSGKFNLPGASLVTLDPNLEGVLKKALTQGNTNVPDLALTIYASNDEPPALGENADKALSTAGYTFHDVRGNKDTALTIRDTDGAGAYTRSGAPDLILEARESGALTDTKTVPPGVSPDLYQKMVDQIKGKKSVLIVLSGTNLFQQITNAKDNTTVGATFDVATPTGSATTPVAPTAK